MEIEATGAKLGIFTLAYVFLSDWEDLPGLVNPDRVAASVAGGACSSGGITVSRGILLWVFRRHGFWRSGDRLT